MLSNTHKQGLAWLAIAVLAILLLWLLAPVLTPFIIGAVLAYVLRPLQRMLLRRRVPASVAALLVTLLAALAVTAITLLLVPIIAKQAPMVRDQLPALLGRLNLWLGPWVERLGLPIHLDPALLQAELKDLFEANWQSWSQRAVSSVLIGGSVVLSVVGNGILVPLVLFYLLLDGERLWLAMDGLVPPRIRPAVHDFLAECDEVLGQYLRGQLLVMGVLACYYTVGLAIAGFSLALPIGVFTGLAIFIPFIGFGLGLLLALVAALLQFGSWYGLLAVALIYGVGQMVESWYLTPKLVGERIGLHPLAVIFALMAFGLLLGFVGVLVALPLSALLLVAVRRLRARYLAGPLYNG